VVRREDELVELVDLTGTPTGTATVGLAHAAPGMLHRAFSVLLTAPDGRLLLQQRAAGKTRFALRWANACCGHPAPGEPVAASAARRLVQELGVPGVNLTPAGVYVYRAEDPVTTRVEHEFDHVLIGSLPSSTALSPDPAEVAAVRWVSADEVRADSDEYAPWLAGVLATARFAPYRG
jgi:isopentenyl-diphosphate Delta-isomerase